MPPGGVPPDRLARQAVREAAGHLQAGAHDRAIEVLRSACLANPGDQGLKYRLCEAMVAGGRVDEAIDELTALIEAGGAAPQPLRLLGSLLFARGRFEDAFRSFAELARLRPKIAEAHDGAAKSLIESGRAAEAIEYLGSIPEPVRTDGSIRLTLGHALFRAGDFEASLAVFEALTARQDAEPRAWSMLARTFERLRRTEPAREAAERALAMDPADDAAVRLLSRLDRAAGQSRRALERLDALLGLTLGAEARAHVCMERGQLLDEAGDFDRAMRSFEEGHRCFTTANPMLAGQFDAHLARLAASARGVPPEEVARWGGTPPADGLPTPVFLIGAPRSGTTLFEQIIGGLRGVTTSDEAPMLVETINKWLSMRGLDAGDIPRSMMGMSDEQASSLRSFYWQRAEHHVGGGVRDGTLVDKHPINTAYLAVVRRLFPDARLICVLRDPRDVVLSMYMQDLLPGRGMLHYASIEATGEAYAHLMRVYLLDKGRLGLRIHETRYEDLLRAPEVTSRELVGFLGLEWDASLLRFAERAKSRRSGVNPYSTSRELFTSSAARWKRYEIPMSRVENILNPYVLEFGYGEEPK